VHLRSKPVHSRTFQPEKDEAKSYLEEILSEGARKLLHAAIESEVDEYLEETSRTMHR
jgi:hypothetical protein